MAASEKGWKSWIGVPPGVLTGAVVVLLPIFTFMTVQNINREKEFTTRLLLEKGTALIRAFEAGTRTGMMGMRRSGFQLQRLITETSQLPDIVHLVVTDIEGTVVADSDTDRVGTIYGRDLDLAGVAAGKQPRWRITGGPGGARVFEVFRRFEPSGPPMGMRRGRLPPEAIAPPFDPPQVIFVGLDMTTVEEARRADVRHAIVMGMILLLVGFAGIALLLMAQGYRTARTTLSRIKAFSDHVVENMPIGLVATDTRQRVVVCNQVAESVLSLGAGQVAGKPAGQVLPPELWAHLQQAAAAQTVIEGEVDCTMAGGQRIPLEVGAGRLADEGGRFLGCILLFRDLSEIRLLRNEIARNQRLATVGRLAAGVAHEIRNPLSSIKGFATYFRERYRDNDQDVQTATILIQEVDRLNRVVGQLLEFSRPVSIVPRPVHLERWLADALALVEPQINARSLRVQTDLRLSPGQAFVDPDRLNQVLLNLLLNAVEAMEPGGTLTIGLEETGGGQLEIRVSDTGRGIRPEDMAHIFEPYFTTRANGTGLGLAIAHNITEAMGGAISAVSTPGRGTIFRVTVPLPADGRGGVRREE